jgi:hypothetical protein
LSSANQGIPASGASLRLGDGTRILRIQREADADGFVLSGDSFMFLFFYLFLVPIWAMSGCQTSTTDNTSDYLKSTRTENRLDKE